MSRPTEPQKKQELLEQCLASSIEVGALDGSMNSIAKRIGTSGRMLIYHFGSKQELENQLIGLLEQRLRKKLWSFREEDSVMETHELITPLLKMWQHLTSPEIEGLLKLSMEMSQRAIRGDFKAQGFLERESQEWISFLLELTNDRENAITLLHLFQGAILDFLTTGNKLRGKQTIERLADALQSPLSS